MHLGEAALDFDAHRMLPVRPVRLCELALPSDREYSATQVDHFKDSVHRCLVNNAQRVVYHVGDDELGDYVLEEQLGTGDVMSEFTDCVSHIQVQLSTETRVEIEVYLPVTNAVDLLLVCWILCAGFGIAGNA